MSPLVILLTLLFGLCSAFLDTEVHIADGPLNGQLLTSHRGREFVAFKGIPYAQPPVGDLRFAPAVPPSKWSQVRNNLKNVPMCTQRDMYRSITDILGQEDCLYLNVFTPVVSNDSLLPVMVFIHGGGLEVGASFVYEPTYLLDKNIVLVVIQYRLGPMGFLSTGDTVCPGNEGLKDQVMALQWVRKNIQHFGGDPDLVTIFGQSAGAASVEAHLISPLSKGLFHRAILESGSSLAPWFLTNSLNDKTQRLATYLGCSAKDSQQIIQCLRTKEAVEIIRALAIFEEWERDPQFIFRAVVEPKAAGDVRFLTTHPKDVLANGEITANCPVMMGLNSEEGFFKVTDIITHPRLFDELSRDFEKVLPLALNYKYISTDPKKMTERLRTFYFENQEIGKQNIQNLISLYTDSWFTVSIDRSARLLAQRDCGQVYLYYFSYRGEKTLVTSYSEPDGNYGVSHGDETLYLFPFEFIYENKSRNEKDTEMIELMTDIWTQFAKTGIPPSSLQWKPVAKKGVKTQPLDYLHIADPTSQVASTGLLWDRIQFWNSLKGLRDKDEF